MLWTSRKEIDRTFLITQVPCPFGDMALVFYSDYAKERISR